MTDNLNLGNDVSYNAAKVVIGGMFVGGLLLGFVVSPWWFFMTAASVVLLRVIVGPI